MDIEKLRQELTDALLARLKARIEANGMVGSPRPVDRKKLKAKAAGLLSQGLLKPIVIGKPKPLRACDARSESLRSSGYLITERVKHEKHC